MADNCASRYLHGGPAGRKAGDLLLPPSVTGVSSAGDHGVKAHRRDRVYLTTSVRYALAFATMRDGVIYIAQPIGEVEHDDDWSGEPGACVCVPSARVLEVHALSDEQKRVLARLILGGASTHSRAKVPVHPASNTVIAQAHSSDE